MVIYSTTPDSTSKASVVQSIPRLRKLTTPSPYSTSSTSETPNKYRQYTKLTSPNKTKFVINGQQRPMNMEEDDSLEDDSQINRPNTDRKNANYQRMIFTKRPIEENLRPITEEFTDDNEEGRLNTGNLLRRQLQDVTTTKNPAPTVEHLNDEHADIYGGALSTTRPLFTTNTPPRVLQRIVHLRNDRPKPLLVNRGNVGPARFEEEANEPLDGKTSQEERDPPQQILIRPSVKPVTDSKDSVYLRDPPEPFVEEIAADRILVPVQSRNQGDGEPTTTYRAIPIGKLLFRPVPQPTTPPTTDSNVQYLTEPPTPQSIEESPRVAANPPPTYVRPRILPRPQPPPLLYEPEPRMRPTLRPVPYERDFERPPPSDYYRGTIALPPDPPNPISMPLSRRDFQVLLKKLLVSQYGVQALNYPKSYLEDALYDQEPYPSYQSAYRTPMPRPEVYETTTIPVRYAERVPLRRPMYVRAVYPPNHYDDYPEERHARRVYRQKAYAQEVLDDGDEILPAPIREALLLRMLHLAINVDRPSVQLVTTPVSRYRKTGPVRSVQIISDGDDDKDGQKKKL